LTRPAEHAHIGYVLFVIRRIAVSALILTVSVGGLGCCTLWAASADAEMGRRADGDACPMHHAPDRGDDTATALQAAAENCCRTVARDDATPAVAAFAFVTALAPAVGPDAIVLASTGHPRDVRQPPVLHPGSRVPVHLLLSVFLI